ncbi:hypothetical protein Ptr902_12565 [Pyrenophora tritici-repentis]|nr:hypothetical protein Ptr902_12565 [Pyrenophora tritici-repentis]
MASQSTPVSPLLRKRVLKVLFISLLLDLILAGLNAYKNSFAKPINSRYDIVLLGGALGSLFSLCQAIASPFIGTLSDKYGRRTALLWSMVGNILALHYGSQLQTFVPFLQVASSEA